LKRIFIKAEQGPGSSVIYYDDKGKKWIVEGGTRTWRNQNPGNMVMGKVSLRNNPIGKAGGFAIFPDYETGHKALIDLLLNEYGSWNLNQLMQKYAPPKTNDTKKYIAFIKKKTGIKESVIIKDYPKDGFEKLWKAIEQMEGWKKGTIKKYSTKGRITKVSKNKKGNILRYLIDGFGWLTKKDAIELANKKKIDAVVVTRKGTLFLRSRPNSITTDNLSKKT
jgi:hypothetical protein